MRQLTAFTKKEFLESLRTGRMPLLVILSVLFGIMNPLTAKLLPWMLKTFTGSLEESGMVLTEIKVDVFTSWTQFYKNIPLFLIIFIVITSGILTTEYQKGTLINILTKGMHRWKLLLSKSIAAFLLWTGCYWISFGVTYAYNMYFWDNSMASHIFFRGLLSLYDRNMADHAYNAHVRPVQYQLYGISRYRRHLFCFLSSGIYPCSEKISACTVNGLLQSASEDSGYL